MANAKQVAASLAKKALTDSERLAVDAATRYQKAVKEALLQEIRDHVLSRELISHKSPSSFLNGARGSLFGYLGFYENTNPVQDLIEFLDKFWEVRPEKTFLAFRLGVRIRVKLKRPSKADFKKAGLILPWQKSLAWPYFIENSISNLPFFLSVRGIPGSLSGEGIQLDKTGKESPTAGGAQFDGVDYITGIFNKNRKSFAAKIFKIKR